MIFEGMLKIRGGWINCKFNGFLKDLQAGKPVMMVIPGGPGLGYEWYANHLHGFEDSMPILYFDPRGCGLSEHALDPSHYTLESTIEDIEALRKHFKLNSLILFGSAYGSILALGYALRYPKALHSLFLLSGSSSFGFVDYAKENVQKIGTPAQIEWAEKLWAGAFADDREVVRFFEIMAPLNALRPSHRTRAYPPRCAHDPLNQAFKTQFQQFNYSEQLKKITCPLHVIVGEKDWIYPLEDLKKMVDILPKGDLEIIPGCGHAIFLDAPIIFRRWLREILQKYQAV